MTGEEKSCWNGASGQGPLWVLNGPGGPEIRLPLFPRKRTQVGHPAMSVSCQYQKSPVYRSTRHHDRGGATPEAQNYSITSLALASNVGGICTPSAFAVLRLMTSSIIVGCSTGRSAGFAPLRILSTYGATCRNMSSRFAP